MTTDSEGYYLLPGLGNGDYMVTPSGAGLYFDPPRAAATINSQTAVGANFSGSSSPYAPPGVPNGIAGQPLTASKNGQALAITWDASTCPAYAYAIVGGMGSDLPSAAGGGFQVSASASVCDAGFSGSYDWTNSPDPAQDSTRFEWFLVVARNETGTEGSWGVDSSGDERDGQGTNGSSGLPCATGKDTSNPCGSSLAWEGVYSGQENGMDGVQRRLAPTLQNPAVLYYAWDHLGTIRLITNDDLSKVERHDYEPYGLELPPFVNQTANTHQFTGHERDLTSGFDYMHNRYYGGNLARFLSPDPAMESAKFDLPQTWNRYIYVVGNPLRYTDPTGRIIDDSNLEKNRRYQAWKNKFLSTEAGRKEWAKWNDREDLTIHMKWDESLPNKSAGAEVRNYKFDKGGKLTDADLAIGPAFGALPDNATNYPVGASLPKDDKTLAVLYDFAHEFGHVAQAETAEGREMIEYREAYVKDFDAFKQGNPYRLGFKGSALEQRFNQVNDNKIKQENFADHYASPIVQAYQTSTGGH